MIRNKRRGGPAPYRRMNTALLAEQVQAVLLGKQAGLSLRQIAARTGMSTTTCWRRYWYAMDTTHAREAAQHLTALGLRRPSAPVPSPPQRGSVDCPRGAPAMPIVAQSQAWALHRLSAERHPR